MTEVFDLVAALRALGLVGAGETVAIDSLAGGVSSDIVRVTATNRTFCVKRALARLKVAALWEAPVERNAAEADYLRVVAAWLPGSVPALLAHDRSAGLFALEYLPPDRFPVWKDELLDGRVDLGLAAAVGDRLGTIHRRSARAPELARRFDHAATFAAIRIEPYLLATARAHPALRGVIEDLASRTQATRLALVHGDVSPKNILCGPAGPVFLDAECATYGDPAFDLAFCLNHLLLKSAARPRGLEAYAAAFQTLAAAYRAQVDWEAPVDLERRCAGLLPALLLARVDGTSPVDYLDPSQTVAVRDTAVALLGSAPSELRSVLAAWSQAFG